MYVEKRSLSRVFPREFRDFVVSFRLGDVQHEGRLGNISEEGMCVILSANAEVAPLGSVIAASIGGVRMREAIEVRGQAVWTETRTLEGRPGLFMGVQFADKTPLPDALLALCLLSEG